MAAQYRVIQDGVKAFIPRFALGQIDISDDDKHLLAEARGELGTLNGICAGLTGRGLGVAVYSLLTREATASSRIEGTTASFSDALAFGAQPRLFPPDHDVREVSNYVEAASMGFRVLDGGELPLCWRVIRQLHARLLSGVRGAQRDPGQWRGGQVHVGAVRIEDAVYVPPPADEMPDLLSSLERYMHSPVPVDPLIRCGVIHAQFELIHPFLDGNGRIGRLLVSLYLKHSGLLDEPVLVLSEYFERNRAEYYEALASISRTCEWKRWLHFFMLAVAEQARKRAGICRKQIQLYEEFKLRLRVRERSGRGRRPAYYEQALDVVFQRVVVTRRLLVDHVRMTMPTARSLVDRFVEEGILALMETKGGEHLFVCQQLLDLIAE
ncbi:MAG: hypothetical protein A2Y63_02970 [Candidatus Riflebacteria bacterium RBG_13_59_9]|nr:MAG: hypothetical protein A2Y63_02970 [Candidatus Riflebacteria bacterium RBG_13_59_9]